MYAQYPIKMGEEDIKKHLEDWENSSDTPDTIEVKSFKQLGETDTYVASYKLDESPAIAVLEKGINNRLKIVSLSSGTSEVRYEDIATDDGIYIALSGVNQNEKISMIEVDLQTEDYSYRVDVPEGDYFTVVNLLPPSIKNPVAISFTSYDKNGKQLILGE
ncbi:hypothetical protein ACH0BF_16845 [Pseudobacillus sp. 179-B 2D1 NHS]|uniref:hypothetical protein n=1 Tax=Pseudobacillus sp. 179-B 2D1 NHS TaxID=3374292 RepID=UPI00387A8010